MNGITDLLKSERGIIGLALLAGATTLAALGIMPLARWEVFVMIIFGTYVAGKTASSVAYAVASKPAKGAAFDDVLTKLIADFVPQIIKGYAPAPMTAEEAQAEVDAAASAAVAEGIPATAPEAVVATPAAPAAP